MKITEFTHSLQDYLSKGQTEDVIKLLLTFLQGKDEELHGMVTAYSAQFYEIKRKGLLGLGNDKKNLNRINVALIDLCADIRKDYGNQTLDSQTEKELKRIPLVSQNLPKPQTPVKESSSGSFTSILAGLLALVVIWRVSSCVLASPPETTPSGSVVEKKDTDTLKSHSPHNTEGVLPRTSFLDVNIQKEDVEILKVRHYQAAHKNQLIFDGKYFCSRGNTAGCLLSKDYFELKVDGQPVIGSRYKLTVDTRDGIYYFLPDQRLNVARNAHQFFQIIYDIPDSAKSVNFKIRLGEDKEELFPIDLNKTIPPIQDELKPIKLNLDTDLHISKKLAEGNEIVSVKAHSIDSNYIMVACIVKLRDNIDLKNFCIRIEADNRDRIIGPETPREEAENGNREKKYEFLVPRTARRPELMIGNYEVAQTAFKVALRL